MTIMLLLQQHTNLIISELQHLMNESPGNLDYHIKQLENENLIVRKPGLLRKRVLKVIEITDKGKIQIKSDIENLKKFLESFQK